MTSDPLPSGIAVHIDGGSRGNPGPAAYAVVVESEDGRPLQSFSQYIGRATNNTAEYRALIAALEYAVEHNYARVRVQSDSELLVRQIEGHYKVKSEDLRPLYERALPLIAQMKQFRIEHVRREQNREADRLVNLALDAAAGSAKKSEPAATTRHAKANHSPADASPVRVLATYRDGALFPNSRVTLCEGEEVEIEIRRRSYGESPS
jgi:probable phosphoglycerate mutase